MMKILNLALFILISMNNGQFPFYVNVDKRSKKQHDKETIIRLFDEIKGEYVLGVVQPVCYATLAPQIYMIKYSDTLHVNQCLL